MHRLFVVAAIVGVVGFVGCKHHHHGTPAPYVNKFLTGATQEGACVRVITKTPTGYTGYLTIDGDNEAAVLVFRNADEQIEGVDASVEDVVICGLTLDANHHLVFEIRSNTPPVEGIAQPFGDTLTEVLDVFLYPIPPPPPPPPPEHPTIVVNGPVITITNVICDVQISNNGVLVATFVSDGSTQLDLEPGIYTLTAEDCNGVIETFTYVIAPPQPDPCTPSLTFLPRGGSTKVLSDRLQGVLDSLHMGGKARLHATTDFVQEGLDAYWQINVPDGYGPVEGDAAALIVIELAGFKDTNVFGIYDPTNASNRVQLFGGSAGAGSNVKLTIMTDGRVLVNDVLKGTFGSTRFGFYIDSHTSSGGGLFFSESQMNPDHKDHMVAYQGDNDVVIDPPGNWPAEVFRSDEFILGFEDLKGATTASATLAGCIVTPPPPSDPSDWDYEDMVILISGVRPKPCE